MTVLRELIGQTDSRTSRTNVKGYFTDLYGHTIWTFHGYATFMDIADDTDISQVITDSYRRITERWHATLTEVTLIHRDKGLFTESRTFHGL